MVVIMVMMVMAMIVVIVAVMMMVVVIAVGTADVIVVLGLQEMGIVGQDALQIEGAAVEDLGDGDAGARRAVEAG